MSVKLFERRAAVLVAVAALSICVSACSSSSSTSAGPSGSATVDPLGTPNAATGTPLVFGMLNLGTGPVVFPEYTDAAQAAVQYVNAYLGGIDGHPIKLVTCATDGTPSTSARCANQILDQKPVAILGGADTGAPGAIPVWGRANLAYLGGVPFTPVEENYPNAAIFASVSGADNAASSVYAVKTLGIKSAAIIYTSDTQGTAGYTTISTTMKNAGLPSSAITSIPVPPTSSDVSSAVAAAVGAKPDLIYIDTPAACPAVLNSLKQLGNTAKLMGIDLCTSPAAIAGANGGADGLLFSSPMLDPFATSNAQTQLYLAALKKYAPASIALDSLSAIAFSTVMNVQAALGKSTAADLTTANIMTAFKTGSDHPNFMAHPYTCDGKQLAGASAVCNAYQQIRQVSGDKIVVVSPDFITAGEYYTPPAR